jgi:tetratricopeptide (TPR) repeat protein
MGLYYADIKDRERAEKSYLAADEVSPHWGGPMFNLGLHRRSNGDVAGALKAMEACLKKEPASGPAKTLLAQCLQDMGKKGEAEGVRQEAAASFGPPSAQADWELGWFEAWAKSSGDAKAEASARKERARRSAKGAAIQDDALRPELRPQMEKKQ